VRARCAEAVKPSLDSRKPPIWIFNPACSAIFMILSALKIPDDFASFMLKESQAEISVNHMAS